MLGSQSLCLWAELGGLGGLEGLKGSEGAGIKARAFETPQQRELREVCLKLWLSGGVQAWSFRLWSPAPTGCPSGRSVPRDIGSCAGWGGCWSTAGSWRYSVGATCGASQNGTGR